MKKFKIWMEGYAVTGQSEKAEFCGEYEGETFKDACKSMLKDKQYPINYYNEERNTYWVCRFFDNRHDAQKSFG